MTWTTYKSLALLQCWLKPFRYLVVLMLLNLGLLYDIQLIFWALYVDENIHIHNRIVYWPVFILKHEQPLLSEWLIWVILKQEIAIYICTCVYCILIMTYLASAFLLPVNILKAGPNNTAYQIVLLYITASCSFLIK